MAVALSPRNRRRLIWVGVLAGVVAVAWWMTMNDEARVSAVDTPAIDALIMPGDTHSQSLEAVAAALGAVMRRLEAIEETSAAQRAERRAELDQLYRAMMTEVQNTDASRRRAAEQQLAAIRAEMATLGITPPDVSEPPAAVEPVNDGVAAPEASASAPATEPPMPLALPSGAGAVPTATPDHADPAPGSAPTTVDPVARQSTDPVLARPEPGTVEAIDPEALRAIFERRGGVATPVSLAPGMAASGLEATPEAGVRLVTTAPITGDGRRAVGGSQVFLPAGSIFSGVLLTGLDAPGGSAARANPVPVLLRLKHEAILPNRFGADVRECFALLSSFGELSSERASMRGEQISCVLIDGTVIQRPLKAYAVGEDGKAGLRGRVVTREGAFIGRALLAGALDGVAQAFNDGVSVSVGQTESVGGSVLGGFGSGFGSAFDRIAEWYLEQADNLFPVIEVDVGRSVDIVLTEGLEFRLDLGGMR